MYLLFIILAIILFILLAYSIIILMGKDGMIYSMLSKNNRNQSELNKGWIFFTSVLLLFICLIVLFYFVI
ncbi:MULTISPECIES: hypothetical protein [Mammaliicoccus]|uniref:Uncharacterized protein n=2 Tax=Mammaliicoccus vitulinus TaxID=71237 RepID=A0A2T4PVA2_9STAP|nr:MULTISPECIES: hypothetical protein [Mammaliicoccus]HAL09171.1 hypothetical protein [Staphylococcus sp.]MBM6630499.1 hypothetical protein [Mammaliicoccus vitulinus]MBO3078216.1 hypothetical protein [Mammaliicoccus vitulinus]MEB7658485.1 hypothetical protein [Mammaliicoccus vitulinus]PNZ35730.1 hypothetical protein CD107_10780 [Mammaliicoccus vitulinus]